MRLVGLAVQLPLASALHLFSYLGFCTELSCESKSWALLAAELGEGGLKEKRFLGSPTGGLLAWLALLCTAPPAWAGDHSCSSPLLHATLA